MPASCYTVRPNAESGWLTFFELSPDRRCEGFFLVTGPLHVSPDSRRLAQGMARQVVTAYKRLLDPDPAEWLDEVRGIFAGEGVALEFGAMALSGERLWILQGERVRLVPLTAAARQRGAYSDPPAGGVISRAVANGDRLFFGRLPREAAGSLPQGEVVRGLEQGGGGDGALILTIHSLRGEAFRLPDDEAGASPAASRPGGDGKESPRRPGGRNAPAPGHPRRLVLLLILLVVAAAAAVAYFLPRF